MAMSDFEKGERNVFGHMSSQASQSLRSFKYMTARQMNGSSKPSISLKDLDSLVDSLAETEHLQRVMYTQRVAFQPSHIIGEQYDHFKPAIRWHKGLAEIADKAASEFDNYEDEE